MNHPSYYKAQQRHASENGRLLVSQMRRAAAALLRCHDTLARFDLEPGSRWAFWDTAGHPVPDSDPRISGFEQSLPRRKNNTRGGSLCLIRKDCVWRWPSTACLRVSTPRTFNN